MKNFLNFKIKTLKYLILSVLVGGGVISHASVSLSFPNSDGTGSQNGQTYHSL